MAMIADVHTVVNTYLEEAVGPAYEIYVVVPINGKLYLTRGAVFSYYEFASNKRLTDEEWQQMINEGRQPERPEWTKSFETEEKKEEIPVPREPYRSGC
jgi:ribosomal protein L24E